MELCPNCHHKLLSHASARCNWCGHVIDDAAYQARAAANRDVYIAQEHLHDLDMRSWQWNMRGFGPNVDGVGGPVAADSAANRRMAVLAARRAAERVDKVKRTTFDPPPPVDVDEAPGSTNRFRRLEVD